MIDLAKRFAKDETGATAIEYAIIAAGIAVAIVTVVKALGTNVNAMYTKVSSELGKV